MDCKNCGLGQRQFFCVNCLKTHLRDFRHQIQHFETDRDVQVSKSSKALESIEHARVSRSTLADYQTRLQEVQAGLARLRKENDKKRDRLRTLRETLASRRRTLSSAKFLPPHTLAREAQELALLSNTIARARTGLVQELVEVFNIVEVGGRPPIGGKAGSKGEWTIGDLILPVPGDMRRYPPDHINAVLTHTIHFLTLLTFYLGVKLPFEIIWSSSSALSGSGSTGSTGVSGALGGAVSSPRSSGSSKVQYSSSSSSSKSGGTSGKHGGGDAFWVTGKLGVGIPWIGAGRGAETGGWAKWSTKNPLHVSSNTITSPFPLPATPTDLLESYIDENPDPTSPTTPRLSPDDSVKPPKPSPTSHSFTTALAMLLYDVCYLAHTQGVDVPLSQAGDAISNLWAVCCSAELGRKSHTTFPYLPPPTPPSFPLDFGHLLQATAAGPVRRMRMNGVRAVNSTGNIDSGSAGEKTDTGNQVVGGGRMYRRGRDGERDRPDKIVEEGWDLVEDDSF